MFLILIFDKLLPDPRTLINNYLFYIHNYEYINRLIVSTLVIYKFKSNCVMYICKDIDVEKLYPKQEIDEFFHDEKYLKYYQFEESDLNIYEYINQLDFINE